MISMHSNLSPYLMDAMRLDVERVARSARRPRTTRRRLSLRLPRRAARARRGFAPA
jgi:hypothetical protein